MITLSYSDDEVSLDITPLEDASWPEVLKRVSTLLRVAGYILPDGAEIGLVYEEMPVTAADLVELDDSDKEVLFDE